MSHMKISLISSELRDRGYSTKGYAVVGRFEQEFLQLSDHENSFCIGPFDGTDDQGEKLVDTSDLWICHKEDLEQDYSRNDRLLPDTSDPFIVVNSIEGWIIREETMPQIVPK